MGAILHGSAAMIPKTGRPVPNDMLGLLNVRLLSHCVSVVATLDIDLVNVQEPLTKTEFLISEVEKELTKMKTDKSPGPDLVHAKVLKMCAQALAMPLTKIHERGKSANIMKRC